MGECVVLCFEIRDKNNTLTQKLYSFRHEYSSKNEYSFSAFPKKEVFSTLISVRDDVNDTTTTTVGRGVHDCDDEEENKSLVECRPAGDALSALTCCALRAGCFAPCLQVFSRLYH